MSSCSCIELGCVPLHLNISPYSVGTATEVAVGEVREYHADCEASVVTGTWDLIAVPLDVVCYVFSVAGYSEDVCFAVLTLAVAWFVV